MNRDWRRPEEIRALLTANPASRGPDIAMRDLLVGVFLFPGQVLVAARASGRWRRPVLLLLAALVLAGAFVGLVGFPGIYRESVDWAEWFGGVVGEVRIGREGFAWERPDEVPFTTRYKRWRVTFADREAEFAPEKDQGRENRGIWITADRVRLWLLVQKRLLGRRQSATVKIIELGDSVREVAALTGKQRFPGDRFGTYARRLLLVGAPFYLVGSLVAVSIPVLAYVLFFTVMSQFFRRRDAGGSFGAVLAVNSLCAVPAACVAAVYAAVGLPMLDFSTVFVLAFFLYIIVAFASVRRMLLES